MLNIAALERDVQTKAEAAQGLLSRTMQTAEKENRLMTEEERAAINTAGADAKAARDVLEAHRSDLALFRDLEQLARPVGTGAPTAKKRAGLSLGQQFVQSEAWEFHRQKGHRSGSAWRSPVSELFPRDWPGMQAATLTEDPASGGAVIQPQYVPGILQLPTRPLVVADLFAPGTTTSNLISYMREKLFTNAAAAVAEGAAKPESALTFEAATSPVRKIAHWLPVTEEMLEDEPQIASYIDARLSLGVRLAEDNELLNGDGVAPHLLGILHVPGLTPDLPKAAGDTNADVFAQQTMAVFTASFLMPDGYVINPTNWAKTVLMKNGEGNYYVGTPFTSNLQQASLWGLPVAVTPGIALGTGLTGAFKQAAQIFRHGGIRVESSNSHQDYFTKNLVAIRAEERLALAVYRPQGFGTVSALD